MKNFENNMNLETSSCQKIRIWRKYGENQEKSFPIGEIWFEGDSFVVKGNEEVLRGILTRMAMPLRGVPVLKKKKGQLAINKKGQYTIDRYINHTNAQPDELVEAVYEYLGSMGGYKVKLEAM